MRLSLIRLLPRVQTHHQRHDDTHAAIACDMLNPAQCPEHALMARIPLGLGPSLHQLRSRSLCLVRGLHSYYGSGFQRLLTIAFRPALRFDVRYLIWEVSLSVSGGIGSPRKTTCGPRSVRLYHPYKVADRRPCPHRPRRSRSRERSCRRSTICGLYASTSSKKLHSSSKKSLFTCSPFDLSHQPTVRGLCLSSCWR
jgi:hypothetical protein